MIVELEKLFCSCVRSAALHEPGFLSADFQPISASRSATVSGTFSGHEPVPPLDDDDVLPPLDDVLPPEDDDEVFPEDDPPEDDPPDDEPPEDDPPDDDPPDDDELFPPDEDDDVFPLDDPPLDEAEGSVGSGSVNGWVVVAVHAKVSAAAEKATSAVKRCEVIAGLLQVRNQPTKPVERRGRVRRVSRKKSRSFLRVRAQQYACLTHRDLQVLGIAKLRCTRVNDRPRPHREPSCAASDPQVR